MWADPWALSQCSQALQGCFYPLSPLGFCRAGTKMLNLKFSLKLGVFRGLTQQGEAGLGLLPPCFSHLLFPVFLCFAPFFCRVQFWSWQCCPIACRGLLSFYDFYHAGKFKMLVREGPLLGNKMMCWTIFIIFNPLNTKAQGGWSPWNIHGISVAQSCFFLPHFIPMWICCFFV